MADGPLANIRRRLSGGPATVVGTLLVVSVGLAVAARFLDLGSVVDTLRGADRRLVAAAAAVYALSWPVRGRRYDDVLGAMGRRCGLGFSTAAIFLSQTANLLVPARAGDGVRAYLLKDRRGVPYARGVASLAVERVFDLLAVAALGAAAAAWLLADGWAVTAGDRAGTARTAAVSVAAAAVAVSAGIAALARRTDDLGAGVRSRFADTRVAPLADAVVRFGADVSVVAADRRAIGAIGAGSALAWAIDAATAVLVLAALVGGPAGAGLSTAAFVAVGTLAVSVGNLAKVLPLSQGGIGLYEAAFTGVVAGIAPIPAGAALSAAILDHALKNGVTLAGGAAAAVAVGASPLSAPEATGHPGTDD